MHTLTPEQIENLKIKHGEIFKITVEDKCCFVKRPDRKTLSYASTIGQKDILKFNEVILNNCWIEGDEEIRNDDYMFLAACGKVSNLIEVKKAELEKL